MKFKMNSLNLAIKEALDTSGNMKEANKAYLEFIKANFIIPVEHDSEDESPEVLFLVENNQTFLPVFTEMSYLDAWAAEISTRIKLLKLSGVDLLKGIGENVTVCLDIGSEHYKEFIPAETARMRSMILKLFKD
ncbi:putative Fe-S center protein [Legionella quateirensis]|uniref:Fe-S center protein n=2 Tax=Legionella quateirensis TaxID=45072 RepID=A0A378KXK9_9GAMM|nr:putative Fe-S center protein [Legionella quateirensis]STY19126.1 putative Fe-S center protein [Legionella quateirensis]